MMKISATIAILLAMGACTTVHQTYAPDGRKAYALNCSGLARGWDKCMSTAGDLCGVAGYDVLDRTDEPTAIGAIGFSPRGGSGFVGSTNERAMMVACKRL